MSNEITTRFELRFSKGSSQFAIPGSEVKIDSSGSARVYSTQSIGTTYEALAVGDVSSIGAVYARNLDTTNNVEIGIEVSSAFQKFTTLKPGQLMFIPQGVALFAKASVSAVALEFALFSQ